MPFRRVFYPDLIVPVAGGGGSFVLSDLFAGAKAGFAFDYRDISTLYQDSARTTAVTGAGDPINGADDVSGNAQHIGWSSGVLLGGTAGAYYADLTNDFIQLPAGPSSAHYLLILDCPDIQAVIAVNGPGIYFATTQSGSAQVIAQGLSPIPTHTINGNTPTNRGQLYTELTTGAQPKLLQASPVNGSYAFTIGNYGGFDLTAKIYGCIVRDTAYTTQEIADVKAYFGAN